MSTMSFGDITVTVKGPVAWPREMFLWAWNYALDRHGRKVFKVEVDTYRNILKVYRFRLLRGLDCHYHEI